MKSKKWGASMKSSYNFSDRVTNTSRRGPRNPHAKALLLMQPGDSFTIPKDDKLRMKIIVIARYYGVPIVTRTVSSEEIRVWCDDKSISAETEPIAISRNVPLPVSPAEISTAVARKL